MRTVIKQIMQAPDKLMIAYNTIDQEDQVSYVTDIQRVVAYGLKHDGTEIVPLIIDNETGKLTTINYDMVTNIFFEDQEEK
jgi:hypothetical protein